MSKIIVFGNQKGGVGKSTIVTLCANALAQTPFDFNVCVVDLDYQKSIVDARAFDMEDFEGELPYNVLGLTVKEFQEQVYELDGEYDIVLVDTAGKLDLNVDAQQQEITKVLMYADYLFIPFRAGSFNLDSTLDYIKIALKIQKLKEETDRPLAFYGFVNMYRDRSKTNTHLISEIENLKDAGMQFLLCRLRNYAIFEDIDTLTSLYDPNANDKAKLNFTVWLNEFIKIMKNG